MLNTYQTQLIARADISPSCASYRFKKPDNFAFRAGQYMVVDLGSELVHPLTISNSPEESGFIEFTKRMTGSAYCQRLKSLEKGENISVKGPMGKFCFDYTDTTVAMIAGGIGITPFRSILTSLERNKVDPGKIILLYGNLNRADIAFRDELENLRIPQYRLVHVLTDPAGIDNAYQGFITSEIIAREIPDLATASYMVSGPPVMVEAIKKALHALAVGETRIRTDIFFGYNAG